MEYTVARALSELTLLDARIARAINELNLVSVQIGSKKINGHIELSTFEKDAKSALQAVEALIARRDEIKGKIVLSNAITKVTFPRSKKVMTVAQVIETKHSIANKKAWLHTMRHQYTSAIASLNREIQNANAALEKRLEGALGDKSAQKGKESAIEEITKNFNNDNEPKFVDPIGLKKVIDALQAEIEEFETENDFLLNESNTNTRIEVSE